MEVSEVQVKIRQLQDSLRNQNYGEAEEIMVSFLDSFPDYETPLLMYARLLPSLSTDHPLYDKLLGISRRYNQLGYFPEETAPDWYSRLSPGAILVGPEPEDIAQSVDSGFQETPVNPAGPEVPSAETLDELLPTPAPIEDEAEEPVHLIDPHSLVEEDDPVAVDFSHSESPQEETIEYNFEEAEPAENPFGADFHQEFEATEDQDDEILIASETMAGIFAQQGKFEKAIKVYRMLMEEEPESMDHYLNRIQELQQQQKLQG